MEINMRPGIYTNCNITKLKKAYQGKSIGIIGCYTSVGNNELKIHKLTTVNEAISLYGANESITAQVTAVLENTFCEVYAIGVTSNNLDQYKLACDMLLSNSEPYCIISDYNPIELIEHAKVRFNTSGYVSGGKLLICNCIDGTLPQDLALSINHERICLAYPSIVKPFSLINVSNALLASMISSNKTPTSNLAGKLVDGEYLLKINLTESEKNLLLYNGVNVYEQSGDKIELIRAVTTKTKNNGEIDNTYRDLSVITTLDHVTYSLKSLLQKRLSGTTKTATLGAILTIVVCELISMKNEGVISDFQSPVVSYSDTDRSICIVEVSVSLAQGVNQIYLNLNIGV